MLNNPRPSLRFTGFEPASSQPTLYHLFQVGASTSAGGAGAGRSTPALTLTGDADVMTLTDGPLAASTTGDFITLVEGDTYDQDAVPQSYSDIESSATTMGQQFKTLVGGSNTKVCVTYHYRGGTAMQLFNDGQSQSSLGYDEMTATIARVKALCDTNGWNYVPHLTLVQSVSGISATAIEDWVDSIRAYVTPTYYSGTLKILATQGKVAGNPEYGQVVYDSVQNRTDISIAFPVRALVIPSEVQGDNIHYTNHGQRRIGVNQAYAAYDNLLGGGYTSLEIDESAITYDNGTQEITVPIIGYETLPLTIVNDFVVYDATASLTVGGSWAVSGSNIVFTISSNKPIGTSTIEFRTDQDDAVVIDSRSNSAVIFNAANASPYGVEKPLVRNKYIKSIVFPTPTVLKRFNFGPSTTPTVTDWESVEGNPQDNTSVDISFTDPGSSWGGFSFLAKNTNTTNKWGFINSTASGSSNLGATTGADTGIVPDDVLINYWYTQGGTDLIVSGFDDLESYTLRLVPSRSSSSSRITQYIIGAVTKTLEANANTANELVFTGVTSVSGKVVINVTSLSSSFGYLNSLIIEEE